MASSYTPIPLKQRIISNFWFAYLAVLACWGANYYAQMVRFLMSNTLFAFMANNNLVVSDFACQYNGAVLAQRYAVAPIDIYDPVIQHAGILKLVSPLKPDPGWYLQYPPQFFALIKPLAILKLDQAYVLWCGLALVLIVWSTYRLSEQFKGKFSRSFLVIATLTAYPACFAFANGNTTLYHFPALIWYWLFLRKRNHVAAGLVSAVFLIKLQFLPFLIPIGMIVGGWRYLAAFAIPSLLFMLYTVWTVGLHNVTNYPHALEYLETHASSVAAPIMQNIRGELLMFLPPGQEIKMFLLIVYALGVAGVVAMWKWLVPRLASKTDYNRAFNVTAAVTILITLVFSPHTHIQDYIALAIVAAFTYDRPGKYMKAVRTLLLIFPAYSWLTIFLFVVMVLLRLQPYFAWTCALGAALTLSILNDLKSSNSEPAST